MITGRVMQMIEPQSTNLYKNLLIKYNIEPDFVEDCGKVQKIYSHHGIFALKKASLTKDMHNRFLHTIQNLHEKGYRYVVPIYRTTDGNYVISSDQSQFYLMPWVESGISINSAQRFSDLLREAARMHSITALRGKINHPQYEAYYGKMKMHIDQRKLAYERFIEKCESRIYMSPFELLFCTYFKELMRSEDEALKNLEEWFAHINDKKESRIVICHGNLSPTHIVYDANGNSYLINFERTFTASPVYDLYYFFRKYFYKYPQKSSDALPLYRQYTRYNQLTDDERYFLFYHLAKTNNIHKLIQKYEEARPKSEKDAVAKLQHYLWQMQAASSFITSIESELETEIFAEETGDGTGDGAGEGSVTAP